MEKPIDGCRRGYFSPTLAQPFKIPAHLALSRVIAWGKPRETIIPEGCLEDGALIFHGERNGGQRKFNPEEWDEIDELYVHD